MDGSMQCWGDNTSWDLGAGTVYDGMGPVPVLGFMNAVQATAGYAFTCAVRLDQTAWCWGADAATQLGYDGSSSDESMPVDVSGLTNVARVAAGGAYACALSTSGIVSCWGLGFDPHARAVPGLSGVMDIAAGGVNCVVFLSGDLSCWGANNVGQLGTGDTMDRSSPTPVIF
jgi:alpha-tubulin suppressor-like RCC1 family protein